VQFTLAESHRNVLCIPMLPHQEPYDRLAGHFHNARTAPAARIMTEGLFGCPYIRFAQYFRLRPPAKREIIV
jgi:hypothetical protein